MLCSKVSYALYLFLFFFFFAGSLFIDFSRRAKQHILHLWGASFAEPRGCLPSLLTQGGGLGDRKMHGSFKLLLLSPSRTQPVQPHRQKK